MEYILNSKLYSEIEKIQLSTSAYILNMNKPLINCFEELTGVFEKKNKKRWNPVVKVDFIHLSCAEMPFTLWPLGRFLSYRGFWLSSGSIMSRNVDLHGEQIRVSFEDHPNYLVGVIKEHPKWIDSRMLVFIVIGFLCFAKSHRQTKIP